MTVHRNRFLVNKTNKYAEFQFYWYYDSTCFGQPFCPSSGVLSRTTAVVHFMQLWLPFATSSRMELRSILLLVANGHHNCTQCRCTAKNSWWWAERLPETCRVVIPIKLEFCSSILLLVANGHHNCTQCRCKAKNSWWWAERLSETCRVVVPIKLEFSASVGFIHKETG